MTSDTSTTETEQEDEQQMMFICGECGEINHLQGNPSEFEGRIFSCEDCGENTLLNEYLPEPPENTDQQ